MDRALLIAALVSTAGCLRDTTFHCNDDSQCGDNGRCEPGFDLCSFPDTSCAQGRRFGALSGVQASQCVGASDAGMTRCPLAYANLPGLAHVYRGVADRASWDDQQGGCQGDGGYLFVPDDAGELAAVMTFEGGSTIWVGVDDQQTQGDFVTVLGPEATFLPWAMGEPNDQGGGGGSGARCVQAQGDGLFHDFRCGDQEIAVCECEP